MSLIQALVLAIIQGLTEFLPVSSSGHLAFFGKVAGLSEPDISFDIVLHIATLFAVLFYYRKELINLALGLINKGDKEGFAKDPLKFLLFVIIATIPTGIIGLYFKDKVEEFHSNLNIVGIFFLITALLLGITYFINKHYKGKSLLSMPYYVPFLIGIVQGLAVMPGISRSGSTIVTALLLGVMAKEAASFSFLISIPAILGAFLLQLSDISGNLLSLNYISGGIIAFIAGIISIKLVVKLVENSKLYFFSLYLVIIGIISFLI